MQYSRPKSKSTNERTKKENHNNNNGNNNNDNDMVRSELFTIHFISSDAKWRREEEMRMLYIAYSECMTPD